MSNNRIGQGLPIALVLALFAAPAMAAGGGTNTAATAASASATVIAPIVLSKTADLRFGAMTSPTGNTEVTVTPATGARSVTQGGTTALLTSAQFTSPGAAMFTVTGDPLLSYKVTLPTNTEDTPIVLTRPGGPGQILLYNFKKSPLGSPLGPIGTGSSFAVGAAILVAGNQAPGTYTGTFSVTVTYN